MKPFYFPVEPKGLHMKPGLHKFGTDFGNGEFDTKYFQMCDDHAAIQHKKFSMRRPYIFTAGDYKDLCARNEICRWMSMQFKLEYGVTTPPYFEQVGMRIDEDFAVIRAYEDESNMICALHVANPGGWRPEDVVGNDFAAAHRPVPHFTGHAIRGIVNAMINRGPYVRFVWSLKSIPDADNHPSIPQQLNPNGPFYLRVERQVTKGFPEFHAALFLIRTYVYDVEKELDHKQRTTLAASIRDSTIDVLKYKGFAGIHEIVCEKLEAM